MTIGRKGADQLRRDFDKLMIDHVDLRSVRQLGYVNALDISQRITKRFEHGEFDVATLFFSQFQNIITQKPKSTQLIPVELPPSDTIYEFEPDETEILHDLLPRNLATKIFSALLGKQRRLLRIADDGDGQRDAQCRRHGRSLYPGI